MTAQQNTTETLMMWNDCEVGTTHASFWSQELNALPAIQFAQCVTRNT
jgi:hypothetical protein